MRVVIVGGSGLIGAHLLQEAAVRGDVAVGTYKERADAGLVCLDLADIEAAERLLDDVKPDWVVHAAGWTWVDGCEKNPERAMVENCLQPARLCRACHIRGIRYAYFSTTYVFDGNAGPYDELAVPAPINVYGRSKREGEKQVQIESEGTALILRTICVWGVEPRAKNFVYQALRALREGRTLQIPSDQRGNPTWAGDLANWLFLLMEKNQYGIWNLAGPDPFCTRVQWFRAIEDFYYKTSRAIRSEAGFLAVKTADLKQSALRPLLAGAITTKLTQFGGRSPRALGAIADVLSDIERNPGGATRLS